MKKEKRFKTGFINALVCTMAFCLFFMASGCAAVPEKAEGALCYVTEDLSASEAARITGIALSEYLDADVALISVADDEKTFIPASSVCSGIPAGNLFEDDLALFLPASDFVVINATGFTIKDTDNHGFYAYGENEVPAIYMLSRKHEMQLADDVLYLLVIAKDEISEGMAEAAVRTVSPEEIREAVALYLEKLETVSYNTVVWE